MKNHLAQLWQKKADKKLQCNLCHHRCVIAEGQKGLCGVRQNQQGSLYSLNYAKTIARHIDPIEKKPLYHFLPGTDIFSIATAGCNFRCSFCQNWQISQITKGKTGQVIGEEFLPQEVVKHALDYNCQAVAYTYTEPTIFFEYAYDTAILAKKAGLKNVFVTNGYQTPETIELMTGLIDAANLDLKSFNKDFYKKICGAELSKVLDTIKLMHKKGIWIELTTLIVPGQNDSNQELKQIAEFIANLSKDIPWHISRFFPTYKMSETQATPVSTIKRAFKIGKESGLNFIYAGNINNSKLSSTNCSSCLKTLIKRDGYLIELNLKDNDRCPDCGTRLPGIFS